MDPVMVMAKVGDVGKVVSHASSSLHRVIQSARAVDPILAPLLEELRALKRSVSAVDWLIISIFCDSPSATSPQPSQDKDLDRLWNSNLQADASTSSTPIGPELSLHPITSLKTQIQSHLSTIQNVLQTLNLYIRNNSPRVATSDEASSVDTEIDLLIDRVNRPQTRHGQTQHSESHNQIPSKNGRTTTPQLATDSVSNTDPDYKMASRPDRVTFPGGFTTERAAFALAENTGYLNPRPAPSPQNSILARRKVANTLAVRTDRQEEYPRTCLSPQRFAEISAWNMSNAEDHAQTPSPRGSPISSTSRPGPLKALLPLEINRSKSQRIRTTKVSWTDMLRSKSPLSRITLLSDSNTKQTSAAQEGSDSLSVWSAESDNFEP
ncbi:hypothetical protein G7Y89_g2783 [Cudoniella acicularis]|uniref:Uncharacterized protein n=1 Tax=Cudoniella acicularis TaxID=354080 RepID=A0A8H4W676_9HELO|nr:hypothetical protein G7Y89_g2783 [Cudoniella acicularis]